MPDGPTVANGSCIIALEAVGHFNILQQLYGTTGTLAVLLRAKERGIIPTVGSVINALVAEDFRLSKELIVAVLHRVGE